MSISSDDERGFYDGVYTALRDHPDDALCCDVPHMRRVLSNPASSYFERRRLYGAVLDRISSLPLADLRVLDYGCGTGDWGVMMATEGARVVLLDLSPVGVEIGLRRARVNRVADRVDGVARDASDLSCFEDAAFDLIFASASLHHTLKYPAVLAEIMRVLKPGGTLLLAETYGNNRILNGLRRFRWWWSNEPSEAGEGILFSDTDLELLRPHFHQIDVEPINLTAMCKRAMRGRFTVPGIRRLLAMAETVDEMILGLVPGLRRYCGEVVVVARGASRAPDA